MIKVRIITGFLGAGKTTFINSILRSNPGCRYGIIENEFGKENIDSKLLIKTESPVVEMTNGCICCSINEDLYEALNYFYARRNEIDELIIEATGVADPAGIAEPFLINGNVKKAFSLASVVCLVDTEQIEDRLVDTKEAISQITFSNIILLNKVELVSESYKIEMMHKLQGLNPLAKVFSLSKNENFTFPNANFTNDFRPIKVLQSDEQHSGIKSITVVIDKTFNIHELHFRFIQFMLFQSKDLYRMKALVYDESYDSYIIQSVGTRVSIDKVDIPDLSTYASKFVFIGKNLKKEGFEKMLEKYVTN